MTRGETEVASDGSHLHIPVFRGPWVDRVIFVESDRVAVEMAKLRPYLVLINAKSPWVYRWGRSSSGWWC
ncbi:rRNA methyltransferase [Cutibacterium acnes]